MRRKTASIGGRSYDIVATRNVISVRDRVTAQRVVDALVRDHGEHAVRELVGDRVDLGATIEDLSELLVARILEGTFVAVREYSVPRLMSAPQATPLIDPSRPVPTEEPQVTDWLGLRLVDAEDAPVVDEPFEVRLPDGTIEKGRTDHEGRARYDRVRRGRCRIVFPRIWATEWRDVERGEAGPGADGAGESPSEQGSNAPAPASAPEPSPSELVAEPADGCPPGTTWLAVEVEDAEGRAVVGLELEITRPDGQPISQVTDGLGRVEVKGLGDGVCSVRASSVDWRVPATSCATGRGYILRAKQEGAA